MAERLEITPGPRRRGYAIGEFLCPGCGGLADVIVAEQRPDGWTVTPADHPAPSVMWWAPWRAWVSIELVCQGPAELGEYDEAAAEADASAIASLPEGATLAEVFAAVMNDAAARRAEAAEAPADDGSWDHAGTAIDMLATGYQPISLN